MTSIIRGKATLQRIHKCTYKSLLREDGRESKVRKHFNKEGGRSFDSSGGDGEPTNAIVTIVNKLGQPH